MKSTRTEARTLATTQNLSISQTSTSTYYWCRSLGSQQTQPALLPSISPAHLKATGGQDPTVPFPTSQHNESQQTFAYGDTTHSPKPSLKNPFEWGRKGSTSNTL